MEQTPQPKVSWFDKLRAPWLRVRYGRKVLPPNQQSSNLHLTDDQVMQRRDEEIGHSFAPPLNKGAGELNEQAGARR